MRLPFIHDDGGRQLAGFKGKAGDCVARSVAIASLRPYAEVYAALAQGTGTQRGKKRAASARNGVNTGREWFKRYMRELGFEWTATMGIGTGCKAHLLVGELPSGRLVVSMARHMTAVIDGVIHDTFDPSEPRTFFPADGSPPTTVYRCVYGYWKLKE